MTYENFMQEVDQLLSDEIGLHHDDLPDCPWRDYFEDGYDALMALESAAHDYWQDEIGPDIFAA